ncbi:MAG TPA: sodium:proton antiporter NhaD [Woeseiaceae bacterium]|nr:sodium:proton antiporter NhaD [Woeseiaceae bacterium]
MNEQIDLTTHWVGITSLILFVLAYSAVIAEEYTHMRKSKPVLLAAGLIWALVGYQYAEANLSLVAEEAIDHFLIEFAQLFLFLLAAMTYVNAMSERNVFNALRAWLTSKGFSYRSIFWITGVMSFFLSPVIDNLTTALVMCAVVLAIGKGKPKFITVACINIVVAANAGGAFSPFGDITTLMVWQRGLIEFQTFFALFIPSAVNYLVPATLMSFAVPKEAATASKSREKTKPGAKRIVLLFVTTVATAVTFHNVFGLPAFMGMMTGLAFLKLFGYYLRMTSRVSVAERTQYQSVGEVTPFDTFKEVARVEWDTLLFFFGVILCVGGLGFIGYLEHMSVFLYNDLGATAANIIVGILSALVDNIPIMVAVLEMNPAMDLQQWLLVTMTAGVGGSMLSIGSAAGVALMGQARGHYTFFGHLRWTPAIALGYFLSIWVHFLVNARFAT